MSILPSLDALEQILKITGEGADVAIDATGISVTANLCINAVHLNGRVVFIGNLAQKIDFPLQAVVTRQISLFGSCASAGEYGKCLELISGGQVDVEAMIDHSVPLSEGGEYILKLYHRQDGLNKVVLLP